MSFAMRTRNFLSRVTLRVVVRGETIVDKRVAGVAVLAGIGPSPMNAEEVSIAFLT